MFKPGSHVLYLRPVCLIPGCVDIRRRVGGIEGVFFGGTSRSDAGVVGVGEGVGGDSSYGDVRLHCLDRIAFVGLEQGGGLGLGHVELVDL